MKRSNAKEPAFFKWIRAVRSEISRDTEGMNSGEWLDYMHKRAERAKQSLHPVPPEESEARLKEIFRRNKTRRKKKAVAHGQ